jgi:SPP1 gp7 family putative phage head morphogenesis protein
VEKRLAYTLSKGVEDALTMQEMSKVISDDIFDVYQGRLKHTGMIARTETATVTSGVRYEVFQTNNIEKQEWLTAKDSRVRESHMEEDGNIVNVGEPFPVTHLHYPSEDGGPAEEVISCRCVALPVEEE